MMMARLPLVFPSSPGWRNRQPRWIQNPLSVRACGFESRSGHVSLFRTDPLVETSHVFPTGDRKIPSIASTTCDSYFGAGFREDPVDIVGAVAEEVARIEVSPLRRNGNI